MRTISEPNRPLRFCGFRKAGLIASSFVVAACLLPVPVQAAPGRVLRKAPETTSQAPATCRPKWPYIVLTCIA